MSGPTPSLPSTLSITSLHRTRGLGIRGWLSHDRRLTCHRRISNNRASNASGGNSLAVGDHGGGGGTLLDWVATWELSKVFTLGTLVDGGLDGALVHVGVALGGQGTAGIRYTIDIGTSVHGTLESITLPSEDIVSMMSIASWVALGKNERLRAIGRPHAIELAGIPSSLEKNHGNADWVGRGACATHEDDTH